MFKELQICFGAMVLVVEEERGAGEERLSGPDRIYSRDLLLMTSADSYTGRLRSLTSSVSVHQSGLGLVWSKSSSSSVVLVLVPDVAAPLDLHHSCSPDQQRHLQTPQRSRVPA